MKRLDFMPVVLALSALVLAAYVGVMNAELKEENRALQGKLLEEQSEPVCPDVYLTCDCPDYEEGFEDGEWVQGCENWEIPLEDLQIMCSGFESCKPQVCDPVNMSHQDLTLLCDEFDSYRDIPGC